MSKKLNVAPMMEAIKKMTKTPASKFDGAGWGTITSISPITLKADNGIEIPSALIELSPFCKEWKTVRIKHKHTYNVSHNHQYDDHDTGDGAGGSRYNVNTTTEMSDDRETSEEIAEFQFWRGLQTGDKVCFIRTNESQKYLILWREDMFN